MTWASVAMYMKTALQQWLHKHALMLHYTCTACLVSKFQISRNEIHIYWLHNHGIYVPHNHR